jgi:hypothetical protein
MAITICDIKIQLREKGIKGVTGLKKAELLQLLHTGKKTAKTEPVKKEPIKKEPIKKEPIKKEPIKKEPVKKEPIKKEPVKKVETPKFADKSFDDLYIRKKSLQKTISDNVNKHETKQSAKLLEKIEVAYQFVLDKFTKDLKTKKDLGIKQKIGILWRKRGETTNDDESDAHGILMNACYDELGRRGVKA